MLVAEVELGLYRSSVEDVDVGVDKFHSEIWDEDVSRLVVEEAVDVFHLEEAMCR